MALQANPISASSPPPGNARRGACPSLDAPMQTGDGLLARLRLPGNRLTPSQLGAIATLAAQHGNGLVEVTARGNLQVRGLTPASTAPFAAAIRETIEIETGLVIDLSPLAGDDPHEIADPRPLAEAIRRGTEHMATQLGPKVSVVIDSGGQIPLAALKADIRLLALDASNWAVTLGGAKPQVMDAEGATAATLAILGALAAMGPEARATDLFSGNLSPLAQTAVSSALSTRVLALHKGQTSRIALPFAAIGADALIDLAAEAETAGVQTIRLAPDHTLLLDEAPDSLIARAASLGFITDPSDPRRRISACIGSMGCASGHIPARHMAAQLASHLGTIERLHVSGCTKGCAHPPPSPVTLVGHPDGIGLVIDGRAGDTPQHIFDAADPIAALAFARRQEAR